MNTYTDSILRVLNGESVVGVAFLVSTRLVATCAHVVESAGAKVGGKISLCSSDGKEFDAIVEPEFWRDANAEDVSILRLENPLGNIQPLILGSSIGTKGHSFSTFGIPHKEQELIGGGEIIGQAAIHGIKVLQLRSSEVTSGFSGAPIFDETTKRIVGMVAAITPPDEFQRLGTTAFAIRSETIREICSELIVLDICPYRSLEVFNEEDAPFFFGRERVVQKMIASLKREPRFLAVLGPSGSGKSSAVRAGLIPTLREGKVLGSNKWGVITIRPTNEPFEQLNSAGLLKSQDGLESVVRIWLEAHPEKTRLILVIDQFEELLVSTSDYIRRKFIKEIAEILNAPVAITIVLTLRDDFYSRFLQDAALLTAWLERGLVNIPTTLEEDELRAIIIEPARAVGLNLEEGLLDIIVEDGIEADRTKEQARSTILPLLEFTLTQLWEKRQDGWLTHSAYGMIGGVTSGLSQLADQAYYNLDPEERQIAPRLLSDLVRPGNETQGIPDTRRVRLLTNLLNRNEKLFQQVIDKFIRVRLLSTWRDEETGLEMIEIIHDALLREWKLLREWVAENRIFLAWRDNLEIQIIKWEESNKNDGALLQGLPLIEAEGWLGTHKNDISATSQEFIKAGIALREKEILAKENLYNQTVKQLERLAALRTIELAISNILDLQITLKLVINEVVKQLGVDAASVLLIQPRSGKLEYVAGQGFHTHNIEATSLHTGEGTAGRAIIERRIIEVPDLTDMDGRFMRARLLGDENFVSYYAVPLITKGEVKGVLEIFNRSRLNPDSEWLDFLETLGGQTAIAIENSMLFQDLQRSNFELAMAYDATIEGWSRAIDLRDHETEGHTQRVTDMTVRLARKIGFNEERLVSTRRGALLHDIGKMGIPDTILHKPKELTEQEQQIMRQHPQLAYDLLEPIAFLRDALNIPHCQHEKWDGTGYPRGLSGTQIPLEARLFAIVDVWDALTSNRPYRKRWNKKKALKYIREQSGKHFDPQLVEVFLLEMDN